MFTGKTSYIQLKSREHIWGHGDTSIIKLGFIIKITVVRGINWWKFKNLNVGQHQNCKSQSVEGSSLKNLAYKLKFVVVHSVCKE